jgi:hypothetical protein
MRVSGGGHIRVRTYRVYSFYEERATSSHSSLPTGALTGGCCKRGAIDVVRAVPAIDARGALADAHLSQVYSLHEASVGQRERWGGETDRQTDRQREREHLSQVYSLHEASVGLAKHAMTLTLTGLVSSQARGVSPSLSVSISLPLSLSPPLSIYLYLSNSLPSPPPLSLALSHTP